MYLDDHKDEAYRDENNVNASPDQLTGFERKLVAQEKDERHAAHERYVAGIQGRDGGHFIRDKYQDPGKQRK